MIGSMERGKKKWMSLSKNTEIKLAIKCRGKIDVQALVRRLNC